jgi:hypothetical protein
LVLELFRRVGGLELGYTSGDDQLVRVEVVHMRAMRMRFEGLVLVVPE